MESKDILGFNPFEIPGEISSIYQQVATKLGVDHTLLAQINEHFSTVINRMSNAIESINRELVTVKAAKFDEISKASYSQVAEAATRKVVKVENPLTIIIKPKNPSEMSTIQEEAFKVVRKIQGSNGARIKTVIKSKSGVLIKTDPSSDANSLLTSIRANSDLLSNNAHLHHSRGSDPSVVLRNVSKLTDFNQIATILCQYNDELKGMEKSIHFKFVMKRHRHNGQETSAQDIVLRVSPKVFKIMLSLGNVFTDYEWVSVKEKIFVRQCQKCFAFDAKHKASECPNVANNQVICGTCGTAGPHNCSKTIKCHNCAKHANADINTSTAHRVNSPDCPLYRIQKERSVSRTNYSL